MTFGSECGEAVEDLHFAAVDQARTAGRHTVSADLLRHRTPTLDGGEDDRVHPVDLQTQGVDVVGQIGDIGAQTVDSQVLVGFA